MELRMVHGKVNPAAYQAMMKLEGFMETTGLDPILYELIKIRSSQINGCSFCIDMHTKATRKLGETEQRIYLISVWRETPFFTAKEKAVLELTEALTRISEGGVPDELYDKVMEQLTAQEYVAVIMAVNTINAWNRLAIATNMYPGCLD
ncbi:carboxymuconolactone decarboxylase family protein [Paenibacillus lycopersici]|uniref:Carboxymuconolactone decarboxylase family protein n=1 Tax=Paenibacillus lycopersici TaxID=2704462 RepID=A0A6C0FVN1_9BACL|nr:carboxymuconolactone decarboxylase family protein [Paenibacillus lycopersici]QHT59483.1 carboxymuconolactone decarboxylase family protein [Paenibacillus lycopersici]